VSLLGLKSHVVDKTVTGLQLVRLAALAEVVLTVIYFATGLWWLQSHPPGSDPFAPADPFLAILEWLIILSAIAFIFIAAGAQATASESRRSVASAGLAFAILFAALTCAAHFVQLTVLPRSPAPIVTWPSAPMALDLAGWDLFFGLSLVCIAVATADQPAWPRRLFLAAGMLCISGMSGPVSGHLQLHLLATIGYAFLFPIGCLRLCLRTHPE
jgi:hypothetical protein